MTFLLFFSSKVFEIWCVFCTYSTSQCRVATFQMLASHMWLVASILDGRDL